MFDRKLWIIFGPKGEEVTGGWRQSHNEELHNFYPSQNYYYDYETKEDEMSKA
jgi:hypothetical protein